MAAGLIYRYSDLDNWIEHQVFDEAITAYKAELENHNIDVLTRASLESSIASARYAIINKPSEVWEATHLRILDILDVNIGESKSHPLFQFRKTLEKATNI